MSKFLLFGATSGLGKVVSDNLYYSGHNVHTAARSNVSDSNYYSHVDLLHLTGEDLHQLFADCGIPDGICFCQRYRPVNTEHSSIDEYQVSVASTALIIEYLLNNASLSSSHPIKVVIVGSTYSTRVGYDQNWSYHAIKHAQLSLVKYYALNSMGRVNIYHISPPTFVKKGAKEYWSKTEKHQKWIKYPPKSMVSVESVADFIVEMLVNGSPLLSGSDMKLDHGVSELYHDQ